LSFFAFQNQSAKHKVGKEMNQENVLQTKKYFSLFSKVKESILEYQDHSSDGESGKH
jgi:hypothetical protein